MATPPRKPKKATRRAPESVERPSSVDRMDPAVQAEITRLRFAEGRHLHEIIDHLKSMGIDPPSQAALGRHVKKLSARMQAKVDAELAMLGPAMQFANAFAEAVSANVADADGETKLRATRELMQAQIFHMVVASARAGEDDPEAPRLDPKQMFTLSRTLQTLAQGARTEDTRRREDRAAGRAEERQKADEEKKLAADAAAQVARRGGMSAETVEMVYRAVLGDA